MTHHLNFWNFWGIFFSWDFHFFNFQNHLLELLKKLGSVHFLIFVILFGFLELVFGILFLQNKFVNLLNLFNLL